MQRSRKILRWAITAVFVITLLPVINLNVERLAEQRGWDQILSQRWDAVISIMASIATNPWFLVVLGTAFGGTLFIWIDYFLRRHGTIEHASSPDTFTSEQVQDLLSHIDRARMALNESETGVTHEGFHEAAALSIKLMKHGIQTPFMPAIKDRVVHETFSGQFCKYLAAIEPYVREGSIKMTKYFAASAIEVVFKNPDDSISPDATGESPSPQEPEGEKQYYTKGR